VTRRPAPDRQAIVADVEVTRSREQRTGDTRITVGIPTFNRAGLLREAIESVLGQTYRNFRLIVSDNASIDETHEVVASLSDARLEYFRADKNIGMIGNFNRLIALTQTEFLMLLPDDDRLYPDYLGSVVEVLQRNPRVGAVHTAFDEIDIDSRVQKSAASYVKSNRPCVVEPGHVFLERSMTSTAILFSSTTYRTHAIREAGGMRTLEEPLADVPLFMRIAQNWDIAYLERPLVAFRVHDQTETTTRLASRSQDEPDARDRLLTHGRIMFDRRMGFLDEAALPSGETNRYRSLATLRFVADKAGLGAAWLRTWAEFAQIASRYPRVLANPIAWRLLAAQLGGRALRRTIDGLRPDH
jgi:cellulose synthase/poly-beta-1,6-N-acetylglucosamine synthase-like glycosyltransferase